MSLLSHRNDSVQYAWNPSNVLMVNAGVGEVFSMHCAMLVYTYRSCSCYHFPPLVSAGFSPELSRALVCILDIAVFHLQLHRSCLLLGLLHTRQLDCTVQEDQSRVALATTSKRLDLLTLYLLHLIIVEPPPVTILLLAR